MSIDRYDPIRVIGEGSFGKVYLMRDKVKRHFVCIKIIKIKNIPKKEREATKAEVDLLRRLHHPNIVRYLDSFLSKNHESLCICMEYCDGGDLASQVKSARRNLFSESKILHWFVQIALGLHYMHQNKVLHRDLKTQNVFLLGNGRLVLGDLGISKVLDGTMDFAQTCIGTPYYMSPEIFKNKPYSYKSDVWALGCVLYEMTTLSHAFDANSLNGLATKIVKGKYPPIHAKYSRFLRELIGQMLLLNPQQRPDLDQILRKPFIKKHIINFFTDIASRPSQSIGEGTMIVRAAAGAAVNGNVGSDSNMISLRQQLHALDMTSAVADALGPKAAPADDVEAIKLAKEQASALKREQEHKQMVEAALEKLRKERESRAKERQSVEQRGYARPTGFPRSNAYAGRNRQQYAHGHRPSGHSPAPAPVEVVKKDAAVGVRDRGMNWNKKNDDDNSSVNSKGRDRSSNRDPSPADAPRRRSSFGDDNKSRAMAERERRALEENRRLQQEQEAREVRIREDRKREEVRAEARARELAKLKEEAQRKEEISAQKKIQELRQQADVASRRDAQRERERERQRNEIEQLKRDKLELDKRAHERDRLREQRRAEERNRLEEASKISPDGDEKGLPVKKEYSPRAPRIVAEDKHEELSARERVVLRKQEKAQKEEADRLEALRVAENENRRIRVAAQYQLRNQYQGDPVLPGVIPKRQSQDEQKVNYEFEPRKQRNPMNMEELSDRLEDATKGKATKFDSSPRANTNDREISSNDRTGHESDDSRSGDESESLWERGSANSKEEEEDLHRKEEELRAELNFATLRVNELKRTLQETKSFIKAPPSRAGATKHSPTARQVERVPSEDVQEEEDEEEYDEDDDYNLHEADEEDEDDHEKYASPKSNNGNSKQQKPDEKDTTLRLHKVSDARIPSSYQSLQDPPSPMGRLSDRIERLRQRCTEALGRDAFLDAYSFLKQHEEESQGYDNGRDLNDEDYEQKKIARIRAILGQGKAHYMSLIEQLIFMEETHAG